MSILVNFLWYFWCILSEMWWIWLSLGLLMPLSTWFKWMYWCQLTDLVSAAPVIFIIPYTTYIGAFINLVSQFCAPIRIKHHFHLKAERVLKRAFLCWPSAWWLEVVVLNPRKCNSLTTSATWCLIVLQFDTCGAASDSISLQSSNHWNI